MGSQGVSSGMNERIEIESIDIFLEPQDMRNGLDRNAGVSHIVIGKDAFTLS